MEMTLSTPALLFSAISLLLLAYSNRFLAIAGIMRSMRSQIKSEKDDALLLKQIETFHTRINLIKYMQAFGVGSLLMAVISMTLLFFNLAFIGKIVFGVSHEQESPLHGAVDCLAMLRSTACMPGLWLGAVATAAC